MLFFYLIRKDLTQRRKGAENAELLFDSLLLLKIYMSDYKS